MLSFKHIQSLGGTEARHMQILISQFANIAELFNSAQDVDFLYGPHAKRNIF